MTRSNTMKKLLYHGPLTLKEIRVITGWTADKVRYTLSYLSETGQIYKKDGQWHLK